MLVVIGSALSRCCKWGEVKKEYRRHGYTGKPLHGIVTWVLVEEI